MRFKHLLAKSSKDPDNPRPEETLVGHTEAVLRAFNSLFGRTKNPLPLSVKWLRFFNLDLDAFDLFYLNGILSCLVHDIGKANSGFQKAVRRNGSQVLRHEHLTGLLLWLPEMQEWLESIDHVDKDILLGACIAHHLRTAPNNKNFADYLQGGFGTRFEVYGDRVHEILQMLCRAFGVSPPAAFYIPSFWSFDQTKCSELKETVKKSLLHTRRDFRKNPYRNRLLMAVRAALICADSAGSGLLREGKDIETWLSGAFSENNLIEDLAIEKTVITPRIKEIEKSSGMQFKWQDFQLAVESLPDRALLLSSCGSGKTLAAWRWIKARLAEHPAARVIFLYPTRATATEGFKDYVSWAPEGILLHSSAPFELEDMFQNPEDERYAKDYAVEERLFALAYWHRRIFSATVHQFLGFMQCIYRSICLMPVLADSVIVIDEVHSFDQALFSALKLFMGLLPSEWVTF